MSQVLNVEATLNQPNTFPMCFPVVNALIVYEDQTT